MVSLKTITTAAALASVACAFPSGVRLATRQAGEMTSEMASAGATAEGAQTTQSAESNAAARGSQAEAGKGAGAEAGAGAGAKAGAGAGAEGAASGQAAVDQKVVQFAGGLEHLETAFYRQCMQSDKLTASDKTAISQILDTEDKHTVKMQLTAVALGSQPIKACKYKFPLEDRNSIMALALMLEETGQAAYLGAAPLISQDVALPLAGAILPIEAQHATVIRQLMSSGGEGGVGVESAGQRGAVPAVPRAFSTA
ncbi:hypothetical protein CDD83_5063 [Cordyceps sp. RAO-2017]|nr:hypothetical protein CDD83_5063 [Cordyceps sp. RAO-2017]